MTLGKQRIGFSVIILLLYEFFLSFVLFFSNHHLFRKAYAIIHTKRSSSICPWLLMFYIFLFLLGTSPFYSSHISLSFAHTFEFDECTFVIAAAAEKVSVWVREWEKDRWTEGMSVRNVCFDMIFPVQYLIITSQHSFSPLLSAPHNTVWPHTYWSKDLLLCMLMPATHTDSDKEKKEKRGFPSFSLPFPSSLVLLVARSLSLSSIYNMFTRFYTFIFIYLYIRPERLVWSGSDTAITFSLYSSSASLPSFVLLFLSRFKNNKIRDGIFLDIFSPDTTHPPLSSLLLFFSRPISTRNFFPHHLCSCCVRVCEFRKKQKSPFIWISGEIISCLPSCAFIFIKCLLLSFFFPPL